MASFPTIAGSPLPPAVLNQLRVLVVVPVFNRSGMIVEALASIAAQTVQPTQVVVVDDGSTDDTPAVVEQWISAHPRCPARLLRSTNRGASAARNLGFQSPGEFDAVAFLDSDDLWPTDFLERTVRVLLEEPGAAAVSADREQWDVGSGHRTQSSLVEFVRNPWMWMLAHGAGIASCTLMRTHALRVGGGFPEDQPTGHDIVLFGRIAARGSWRHSPGLPVVFRRHGAASAGGQEGHLHHRYPDYAVQWAKVCEVMVLEAPARAHLGMLGRKLLAKRWRRAAQQAFRRGDMVQAKSCVRRALRWWPWSLRTWITRLHLATGWSGSSRPSSPRAIREAAGQ